MERSRSRKFNSMTYILALGGKMVAFAGFNIAKFDYSSGIMRTPVWCGNGVGVFDVSHMGEFYGRRTEALNLIQKVTSNGCFPN